MPRMNVSAAPHVPCGENFLKLLPRTTSKDSSPPPWPSCHTRPPPLLPRALRSAWGTFKPPRTAHSTHTSSVNTLYELSIYDSGCFTISRSRMTWVFPPSNNSLGKNKNFTSKPVTACHTCKCFSPPTVSRTLQLLLFYTWHVRHPLTAQHGWSCVHRRTHACSPATARVHCNTRCVRRHARALTACTVTHPCLLYAGELDGELQGGVRRDLARSVGPAPRPLGAVRQPRRNEGLTGSSDLHWGHVASSHHAHVPTLDHLSSPRREREELCIVHLLAVDVEHIVCFHHVTFKRGLALSDCGVRIADPLGPVRVRHLRISQGGVHHLHLRQDGRQKRDGGSTDRLTASRGTCCRYGFAGGGRDTLAGTRRRLRHS
mmetsp:Transcript_32898/g.52694  ORF Transcript_32898/g.52694 Transcript_32898/m.52694 type:complete len:374 (-) Transcript_32898:62-1183(-)